MEEQKNWLQAKKRHEALLIQAKKFAGISIIATLVVGPLLYFSVFAGETGQKFAANLHEAATPEVEIAATAQITLSEIDIPFPEREERNTKFKTEDLGIELDENKLEKITNKAEEKTRVMAQALDLESIESFETMFQEEELEIRSIKSSKIKETREVNLENLEDSESIPEPLEEDETLSGFADENGIMHEEILEQEEETLIINNLKLETGPSQIKNEKDASQIARTTLKKYTQTLENRDDFVVLPDTSKLDKQTRPEQLVLSKLVNHNGKWYIWFDQYHEGKPVFDGEISLILTESKKLLTLTDTIKLNLPSVEELKVGKALAKKEAKEILEWDDSYDDIEHIEQGFYDGEIAYKVEAEAHNPLGTWEVYIDGIDGEVIEVMSDIRMQGPATPEPSTEPETENPATAEPETENPEDEDSATTDPETTLEATVGQILGYIFPETPEDERIQMPFRDQYVYIGDDATLATTDVDGYFENLEQEWYSMFLSGPYVTVYDDAATTNAAITNNTPGVPFVWDEPYASPEAINAFYHTNKIRDYFYVQHGYEMNVNIPVTVNSELAKAYVDGCNSWYNNTEKTIEIGSGAGEWCENDTNYALSSDIIYHEYTHAITENIGHWPYVDRSEAAAISEGLSDYFATTINDDSVFGEIASPDRIRNLNNTANYQTDMTGDAHDDSMPFAGALWDLRAEIGTEETDALIFNTLYQNKTHFETFMYGMIVEDDNDEDFSNGTPHLIEIIQAFENHGIGPGVLNFNGLPIDPEAWSQLLADAGIEGEGEEDLYLSYTGTGCSWSGTPEASSLTVSNTVAGIDCRIYNTMAGTLGAITVNSSAQLVIGSTNSTLNSSVPVSGDVTVYGTLSLGYTGANTNSLTLNGSSSDLWIRSGGTVDVGWYTDPASTNTLSLTGSTSRLYIYDGGTLDIDSNSNGTNSFDTYDFRDYGTATLMDNTVNDVSHETIANGSILTIGNGATLNSITFSTSGDSTADATVTIDGYLNTYATRANTVNINAYSSTSEANVTVGSTGLLYATTFNIGTDTQVGGNLINNNTVATYGAIKMGNYATFTNNEYLYNNYSTTAQSFTLYNGAFYENNDRTWIYGYTYMYDNCDIQNDGEASDSYFKTSRLYMSELTTEAGLGPVFTNNSSYGTLDIDTASSNNDILMYQDAVLDNNSGADVDLYDDLQMFNDSLLTNDGSFYMYGPGNLVYMLNNAEIINGASDRFWIGADNDNQTPTQGTLDINTSGNVVSNTGQFRMHTLDMDEGLISNKSGGGDMRIYGNADVYRGTLQNIYGSTNFDITGTLTLGGPSAGYEGTLDNDGSIADIEGSTIMNAYSFIDNSRALDLNGGLEIAANNADIKNDYTGSDIDITGNVIFDWDIEVDCDGAANGDLSSTGYINLEDTAILYAGTGAAIDATSMTLYNTSELENNGGTVTLTNNLTTEETSVIDNNSGTIDVNGTFYIYNDFSTLTAAIDNGGTIEVYEDIMMTPRMANDGLTEFENTGTVTIDGSTTNILKIEDSNKFNNNGGTLTVDETSGALDGLVEVYQSSSFDNSGTATANVVYVGKESTSSEGGTLDNQSGGDLNANSLEVYRGTVENDSGATDIDIATTIYLAGIDTDPTNLTTNAPVHSANITVTAYANVYHNSSTVDITDTTLIQGDATRAGVYQIDTSGTFTTNSLNLGTSNNTAGRLTISGALTTTDDTTIYNSLAAGTFTCPYDLSDTSCTAEIFINPNAGAINFGNDSGDDVMFYDYANIYNNGDDFTAQNLTLGNQAINASDGATFTNTTSGDVTIVGTIETYGGITDMAIVDSSGPFDANTIQIDAESTFWQRDDAVTAVNLNIDDGTDSNAVFAAQGDSVSVSGAINIDGGSFQNRTLVDTVNLYMDSDDAFFNNDAGWHPTLITTMNYVIGGDTSWPTSGTDNTIDLNVSGTAKIYNDASFINYDSFIANQLLVGSEADGATYGGSLYGDDDSRIYISGTTATSGEVYGGLIQINTGSDNFSAATGSTLTVHGALESIWHIEAGGYYEYIMHYGEFENNDSGNNDTKPRNVIVGRSGLYDENALSYLQGSLVVNGAADTNGSDDAKGLVDIADGVGVMHILDPTNIEEYGYFNNEYEANFHSLLTVDPEVAAGSGGGHITSDNDSAFNINHDITTGGTVDMQDNVTLYTTIGADGDFTVTDGVTTLGYYDGASTYNVGLVIIPDDILITGGNMTTYSVVDVTDDVTVQNYGASLDVNYGANGTPLSIYSHMVISDSLAVIYGGEMTINARDVDTTAHVEYGVRAANTTVSGNDTTHEATLIVNSALASNYLTVGSGGGEAGTITHDEITSAITNAEETMVLWIEETVTVNTNGSINADRKSGLFSTCSATRGGSYGGVGQSGFSAYGDPTPQEDTTLGSNTTSGTLEQFGRAGCNGASVSDNGGGVINLLIGTSISDFVINDDNGVLTIDGSVSANGSGSKNGGGSGGAINIIIDGTVNGNGTIVANGGNSEASDAAGGGGRIFIQYDDKNLASATVQALGGQETITGTPGHYAGTGTIFYRWTDIWKNQNDGTLIIDGFSQGDDIDVDADGLTAGSGDNDDYTRAKPPGERISVESIQLENEGYAYLASDQFNSDFLNIQQCIKSSDSNVFINALDTPRFNRDHGPDLTGSCYATPDPPHTQYLNDSFTGAQSAQTGNEGSPASVYDLTPNVSAIHNDGELTSGSDEDEDGILRYQIYVADSAQNLFDDVTVCTQTPLSDFSYSYPDDTRTADFTVSECSLSVNSTYYWKIRFEDDDDGDASTTPDDQGWGLWSATQTFDTDEGGSIKIGDCSNCADGSSQQCAEIRLDIDASDLETNNYDFDKDYCEVGIESSVNVKMETDIDQVLTHTTNGSHTIPYMTTTDVDNGLGGGGPTDFVLDGFDPSFNSVNEIGWYMGEAIGLTGFIGSGPNGEDYDASFHILQNTTPLANNPIETTSPLNSAYFNFWLGSYVHKINGNGDVPLAGIYDATTTLTLSTNP